VVVEHPRVMPDRSDDLFAYAFRRADGRQIVTAWVKSADRRVDIAVARDAAVAVEHSFDGSVAPYARFGGRTLRQVELRPGTARIFELRP
jgi:hypothetical protein